MSSIGKVVGKVVGGITGSTAAAKGGERAARTQAAAAQAGIDEQRRQFDYLTQLMQPYVEAGAGTPAVAATPGGGFDAAEYLRQNPDIASVPAFAENPLLHYQRYGQAEGRAFPTLPGTEAVAATPGALQAQQGLIGLQGPEAQQQAIDALAASPAYTSLVQQGEEALLQNASATGGLRGGNVQGALAQFRPQLLSQLIESQYQKLGGITQLGQSAAAGQASAGLQTGSNIGNLLQQQGAATAGGQLARAGAQRQAFGDLLAVGQTAAGLYTPGKGFF